MIQSSKKSSKKSLAVAEGGKFIVGPTISTNWLIVVGRGNDEGTGIDEGRLTVEVDGWIALAIEGHEEERGTIAAELSKATC